MLIPQSSWKPYPAAADREGWNKLSEQNRRKLIQAGEQALAEGAWASLPATVFFDFKRNGNRSRYEAINFARRNRLRDLVMAECAEGRGRFMDEVLNGLWLVCEETFWGLPAHLNAQKAGNGLPDTEEPIIDLFAAETAAEMAWLDYLLADSLERLSPLVRKRIHLENERRILTPFESRDDFGWMGLDAKHPGPVNNWNPWIHSNVLTVILLQIHGEARRARMVHKSLTSLDRFLDSYHEDGGCDEGPSYWSRAGGSLYDCLSLLHSASNGKVDFFEMPLVAEIGRYIYRAHISDLWYVNFADASAKVKIDGTVVYQYGRHIHDAKLQAQGAYGASLNPANWHGSESLGRQLPAVFLFDEIEAAPKQPPLVRDVWLPGVQVFAARVKEGSDKGFYLAAQGGHNAESHNHNDVGNFILYFDGQPALIDVGVETYTAKTFSAQRYDIWTMQSGYHNLPTINGVMQAAGRQFEARDCTAKHTDQEGSFSLNIAHAYPESAGVDSWQRTFRLNWSSGVFDLVDEFQLKPSQNRIEFTLMTPCRPELSGSGLAVLSGAFLGSRRVTLHFDPSLTAQVDDHSTADARLHPIWGDRVYRLRLSTTSAPSRGSFRLTAEGAV